MKKRVLLLPVILGACLAVPVLDRMKGSHTRANSQPRAILGPIVEGISTSAPASLNDAVTIDPESPLSCSQDGRFVVFVSHGPNLIPGQIKPSDSTHNVFLFDRLTRRQMLVSHQAGSATRCGNLPSLEPQISADGRFVVFTSSATDLVAGSTDQNNYPDIFLFERETGTITLLTHQSGLNTTTSNGSSTRASISSDGRFVAFQSTSNNLLPISTGSGTSIDHVYLVGTTTLQPTLVEHTATNPNVPGDAFSKFASISPDGSFVTFTSGSSNLIPGQLTLISSNLFVFNRLTGAISLVTHDAQSQTTTGNNLSELSRFSPDGGFIIYSSRSTNLVTGMVDTNQSDDVFVYNLVTGTNRLVSHRADSAVTTGAGASYYSDCSRDGRFIVFSSGSADLIPGAVVGGSCFYRILC